MRAKGLVVWILVLGGLVAAVWQVPSRASPSSPPLQAIRTACESFNPYFAVTNFVRVSRADDWPDEPAIVAFRDTAADDPTALLTLATQSQVGAVYGLAYDAGRGQLYAAAYHKRSTAFGPGGPGQVYRIDLAGGQVEPFVALGAGADQHDYRVEDDLPAADRVGIASLGDIELDDGATTLFVANLFDGKIYRFSVPDGAALGWFRHGAAATDWARNARLFGLGFRDGWLYHGVVNAKQFTTPGRLSGHVYRSRPDGSEMTEVLTVSFAPGDYPRTTAWRDWSFPEPRPAGSSFTQFVAQPMLADIEFTADGRPILGIRDRMADRAPVLLRLGRQPGVGDILPVEALDGQLNAVTFPEHYLDSRWYASVQYDELSFGSLAALPGFDIVLSAAYVPLRAATVGAYWYWNASGSPLGAETIRRVSSGSTPGSNGLGDVEVLCPRGGVPGPGPIATATSAAATATAVASLTAAVASPTPMPPSTPPNFPTVVAASCGTGDPYVATICYPQAINFGQPGFDAQTVVAFKRLPPSGPVYMVARHREVGAVWGLAYNAVDGVLYAADFHKRLVGHGFGGPGAIYQVDIGTGRVTLFAVVPDAGPDQHASPGMREPDTVARDWAGKLSLGDLDLSTDQRTLFVVNLYDRYIYRYDVPGRTLLGRFPHGAAQEPWARDARPFGLKFYQGKLYHGVVNSAESSNEQSDLAAYVYESEPDGSNMRLVVQFPLDYDRGTARLPGVIGAAAERVVPLDWLPWSRGYNDLSDRQAWLALYPQPILSDIEFMANGDMVIGLRDRHSDMALSYQINIGGTIKKPGIGLGDFIRVPFDSEQGWGPVQTRYFGGLAAGNADRTGMGGLAHIQASDWLVLDRVYPVLGGNSFAPPVGEEVMWYEGPNQMQAKLVCRRGHISPATASAPKPGLSSRPLHNEYVPSRAMGDVEVLCGPQPTATTPVPPDTPTVRPSPTPSPTLTRTATAMPSATPTRTPVPQPIYLPLSVEDQCDPRYQHVDAVLVLDASTTMLYRTRAGRTKMAAAKEAALLFLYRMKFPGDQLAVISFNNTVTVHQGLTGNRAALEAALRGIRNQEYTRIHLGIAKAHELLTGSQRKAANTPAMIVLTDGISNPDPVQYALDAARAAREDGITIYTVGLGEDIQAEALRQMASRPELYRYAPDGEDLGVIYQEIAHEIPCPPSAYWPHRP